MNSLEITCCLKTNVYTKNMFKGVYSADEFAKLKINSGICIVNSDVASQPGHHWICIFLDKNIVELFDSSGKIIFPKKYLQTFLKTNVNKNAEINFNNKMIQSPESNLCGQYCCIFALYKAKKKSFDSFLNMFHNKNLIENDNLVVKLFNNNFVNLHVNCFQICNQLKNCKIK